MMSVAIDSWESLKPDLLVERGIDPAIASAAGSLAVRRKHGSAERGNLLGTIEELQTTVDTQAAEIEELRGMLGVSSEEEKKDTRVTARRLLAELEIGPIIEEILAKGGNPKDLYESARMASDLKGFSERLEVDKSALVTSVRHMGYA